MCLSDGRIVADAACQGSTAALLWTIQRARKAAESHKTSPQNRHILRGCSSRNIKIYDTESYKGDYAGNDARQT